MPLPACQKKILYLAKIIVQVLQYPRLPHSHRQDPLLALQVNVVGLTEAAVVEAVEAVEVICHLLDQYLVLQINLLVISKDLMNLLCLLIRPG